MRYRLLTIALMLFSLGAAAQTLGECRRLARENYPEIQQYGLVALTEEFNLSNAAKAWLPQVQVSGQASWQTATARFPEELSAMLEQRGYSIAGMRKDQYRIAVDVQQNIWDGGKSAADRAMVRAQSLEQRRQTDVDLYALQQRVDNLYFGILLLDERAAQTRAMIELLDSNLSRMRVYFKNGVATLADVDALEAELLTARQQLVNAESSSEAYRRVLSLFIGRELQNGPLARPAAPSSVSDVAQRPQLALFDARAQTIEAQKRALDAALMPRISAFAQGYYGYPGMDMFKSMRSGEWTLNAMIGVRVQWNLGALYTRKNNVNKLNTAARSIDVARSTFLFNNRLAAATDNGEIERLRRVAADDSRIVELRRNVRLAAESQLRNGVIDSTDLLRKITDENTAAIARSQHEIELLQAQYKLQYTLNQ